MKYKKLMIILITVLFVCFSISTNVLGDKSDQKRLDISKRKIPGKAPNPVFKIPHIDWLSPDFSAGQVIEVWGKNFGQQATSKKFYLGGSQASIKYWSKDFILLHYPDSPILGKILKAYIKGGDKIISNQASVTLKAIFRVLTKRVFVKYKPHARIKVKAAFSGINKVGMKLRFRKKGVLKTLPVFGNIISIVEGGEENTITAALPNGLNAGTYLVDLFQDGRVASNFDEFRVMELILIKKK